MKGRCQEHGLSSLLIAKAVVLGLRMRILITPSLCVAVAHNRCMATQLSDLTLEGDVGSVLFRGCERC